VDVLAGDLAGDFAGVFAGDFTGDFAGDFWGDFSGVLAGEVAGDFAGDFAGVFAGFLAGVFAGVLAGDFLGVGFAFLVEGVSSAGPAAALLLGVFFGEPGIFVQIGGVDVCLLSLCLGALPADAPGQLHVPWHDGHPLGVDGAQVRVFEQADEVRLGSFLERLQRRGLEPPSFHEVGPNLPYEALERRPAEEQVGGLLVPPDLPQRDRPRTEPVRLLHASRRWL
jgi:hypothetical protein